MILEIFKYLIILINQFIFITTCFLKNSHDPSSRFNKTAVNFLGSVTDNTHKEGFFSHLKVYFKKSVENGTKN